MSYISHLHIVDERRLIRRDLLERFPPIAISHGALSWVTLVAERRRREICDSSLVRTHAQPRAELEFPRARVPYMAGCESSPPTVLRTGALTSKWKRDLAAYASLRSTTRRLAKPQQRWSIAQTTGADHCHSTGTIHHPVPNFQTQRYHRPNRHATITLLPTRNDTVSSR